MLSEEFWRQQIALILNEGIDSTLDDQLAMLYDRLATEVYTTSDGTMGDFQRYRRDAIRRFETIVRSMECGSCRWDDHEDYAINMLASLNFVIWYLHRAWREHMPVLDLQTARLLAHVFTAGMSVGECMQREAQSDLDLRIPPL